MKIKNISFVLSFFVSLMSLASLSSCSFQQLTCDHEYRLYSDTATCGQDGEKKWVCQFCNKTKTEKSEATGEHDYHEVSNTATCTNRGRYTYKCSICNDVYEEPSPAGKHSFKTWDDTSNEGFCTSCGVFIYNIHLADTFPLTLYSNENYYKIEAVIEKVSFFYKVTPSFQFLKLRIFGYRTNDKSKNNLGASWYLQSKMIAYKVEQGEIISNEVDWFYENPLVVNPSSSSMNFGLGQRFEENGHEYLDLVMYRGILGYDSYRTLNYKFTIEKLTRKNYS